MHNPSPKAKSSGSKKKKIKIKRNYNPSNKIKLKMASASPSISEEELLKQMKLLSPASLHHLIALLGQQESALTGSPESLDTSLYSTPNKDLGQSPELRGTRQPSFQDAEEGCVWGHRGFDTFSTPSSSSNLGSSRPSVTFDTLPRLSPSVNLSPAHPSTSVVTLSRPNSSVYIGSTRHNPFRRTPGHNSEGRPTFPPPTCYNLISEVRSAFPSPISVPAPSTFPQPASVLAPPILPSPTCHNLSSEVSSALPPPVPVLAPSTFPPPTSVPAPPIFPRLGCHNLGSEVRSTFPPPTCHNLSSGVRSAFPPQTSVPAPSTFPPPTSVPVPSMFQPPTSSAPFFLGKPRISTFSGAKEAKNTVSFYQWRYEVNCLRRTERSEVVLLAIRQSLRHPASDVLLHMGESATIEDILAKFNVVYGNVLPTERLLESFYTSKQGSTESVAAWGCRLEGLLNVLKEQSDISSSAEQMLRSKFWSGICDDRIRFGLRHLYDASASYEQLLLRARILEQEMSSTPSSSLASASVVSKPVQVQQVTVSSSQSGIKELSEQVKVLSSKFADMEERRLRRRRNVTCHACGEKGHYKRECPGSKDSASNPALNSSKPV